MKMPNGEQAVVVPEKLLRYALDPTSEFGRHKARVFARALGISQENAELLRTALLGAALTGEAITTRSDQFGQRYQIDFQLSTPAGAATVRSAWIIETGSPIPRLITCYVLE